MMANHALELKEWLDSHGFPAPQPTTRDKLVASVRRNSHLANLKLNSLQASISKSAADTIQTLSDALLDSWSDSREFSSHNLLYKLTRNQKSRHGRMRMESEFRKGASVMNLSLSHANIVLS
jgi:hypothetical protein